MKSPVYKKYNVFHKGEFVEEMTATNKENAIWGVRPMNDSRFKKDYTAEIKR